MIVSILGCGWYGRAVAADLLSRGIVVKGSATSRERADQLHLMGIKSYVIKFDANNPSFDPDFFKCDTIIIALPPGFRKQQGDQYLPNLQQVARTVAKHQIENLIYISSTGVYADCNRELDENDLPEPDTGSGRILFGAEQLFQHDNAFRSTIIRFGGLVGPGRDPARFFLNKTQIPNGQAPVNLIHLADCVGITQAIIEKECFGAVFNACTPDHPIKMHFYSEMAKRANLPVPLFTDELKNWKIVNSVNLIEKLNYEFIVKSWNESPVNGLFD